MKSFRTELTLPPSNARISLSDRVLTVGSCFSDAIGAQFSANKIITQVNPFGTVYNPHSIHKVILYAIKNESSRPHSFLQRDDIFLNYDFHSDFSSMDLDTLKAQLEQSISRTHSFLREANWLMITYGTSWIYALSETSEIVANCHKMPQRLFTKSLLSQQALFNSFEKMYTPLKSFNPDIKIILTISPVRHIKDTIEHNSLSKAVLRVASHTLVEQFKDVYYFPAYEIMMDDLRDYRFYKPDMIHPSEEAEQYIWDKFSDHFFEDKLKDFVKAWREIANALAHRPSHPGSSAHQSFLQQTLKKLAELKALVNVDQEMRMLEQQLEAYTRN